MTNHIINYCEQRSEEWYNLRKGVITASACEKILTPYQKKSFIYKMLAERLTDEREEFFVNEYMQRGIDKEDEARVRYEKETAYKVQQVGFVFRNTDKLVGCSPDGLVGEDGLVEIKCPATNTHLSYFDDGAPKKYIDQMQFQMYCFNGERQWCDFFSWDDRVKNDRLVAYLQHVPIDIHKQMEIDDAVTGSVKMMLKFLEKHNIKID